MRNTNQKRHHHGILQLAALVLLLLMLIGLTLARMRDAGQENSTVFETEHETEKSMQEGTAAEAAAPEGEENKTVEQTPHVTEPVNPGAEYSAPTAAVPKHGYTEETYQLVTDLVYAMRNQGDAGEEIIRTRVEDLKHEDPELGKLWEGITAYWFSLSRNFEINRDQLPEGLPQDGSLCIVVLGYQLMYDGEMTPELIGRCETALRCAAQYPNAYLLVTGGGTALGNRDATEAGVMAEWFLAHGIAKDRIIVEQNSMTTGQNATNSCAILTEQYPQIHELAVVSSDYHVAQGSMLFTEAALLYAYENNCDAPYQVVANSAFATAGNPEYSNPRNFATDIWIMANPNY